MGDHSLRYHRRLNRSHAITVFLRKGRAIWGITTSSQFRSVPKERSRALSSCRDEALA